MIACCSLISAGCIRKVYAGEVLQDDNEPFYDPDKAGEKTITVNGINYDCKYDISYTSIYNGRTADRFRTGERGRIIIDSESGKVIGFYNIMPFERFECAMEMNDEELINAVRELLSVITDVSVYNKAEVTIRNNKTGRIAVKLYQHDELELNNSITVAINKNGEIDDYSFIDGCPEGTKVPKISDKDIDLFIRTAIKENMSLSDPGEIRMNRKVLTVYNGRPALIITVEVCDKAGFSYGLLPILISEKQD